MWTPTANSALPSQIGDIYDIAIGYSTDGETGEMVGYVSAPGSTFEQDSDITDSDRIVQISSPNTTDRYTTYPKVSQGDWSGGERQVTFETAAQFWTSNGLDVSQPGHLTMLPPGNDPFSGTLVVDASTYESYPLVTDGTNFYLGHYVAGSHNLYLNATAGTTSLTGTPVIEMLVAPAGIFLYHNELISLLAPNSFTETRWATAYIDADGAGAMYNNQNMAYFGGNLYWINNASGIMYYVSGPGATAGTVAYTALAGDGYFSCLCSTATGLFFSQSNGRSNPTYPFGISILYTFSGSGSPTRIGAFQGIVRNAIDMEGTTYILAAKYQTAAPNGASGWNYTLYSLVGTTLAVVDDLREALPEFWATGQTLTQLYRSQLFADGNDLYIAWNGLPLIRYNTVTNAVSRVNNPPFPANPYPIHRVTKCANYGLIDLTMAGGTAPKLISYQPVGSLGNFYANYVSSWFDFGTPAVVKVIRQLTIELNAPLLVGNSIAASFITDTNSLYNALPMNVDAVGNYVCNFPAGTLATRVQIQLSYTGIASDPAYPDVKSYSLLATLGRVWKVTLACRRNQRGRNDEVTPHRKRAIDLMANLENAYNLAAGSVTLYVPDSTATAAGPTGVAGVSQVNATIQTINRINNNGSAPGLREDPAGGEADMEADYQIQLSETL